MNKETFLSKLQEAKHALYDAQLAIDAIHEEVETGEIRIKEPTTLANPVVIAGYQDEE